MNVADSDFMSENLINAGYEKCNDIRKADIIIVNTCTVRQHAEERALSFIGELKKLKNSARGGSAYSSGEKNKKLKIFIAGCVASRLKEKLKKKFPYIDKIIPVTEIEKFSEIVKDAVDITPEKPKTKKLIRQRRTHRFKWRENKETEFVTITKGCSNFCSYCIVPFVRGGEISKPKNDILADVKKLISQGRSEVTLLGQNVNSYKVGSFDFSDLLIELNKIPQIKKINFMTSHPKDMSDKIINAIASCKKVARQIHLPVQSGSNKILKLMNRKYTREKYLKIIKKLKNRIPDVAVTTDIIVGFPTETEKDFQQTLDIIKKAGFKSAFTFKYSPRENTTAFNMKDDVPRSVKKERLARLNTIFYNNVG
ncbi:MAG: tRNA (N6-isopentenyl adenosine(37)-C2)-methylthiotransferase MiaB [Elusimicrobia bacterium HGW-Elusimicrobia-4]|nr:MAG: tRNA (N6-isopentenyl adenosine(37)-C2)-methylthiotransferase MiaB [Elusimicrobia bacterium HGW-Elusimicrobia-4]